MNISFDLDSTLIPNGNEFETEKRSSIAKWLGVEPIRNGTAKLFLALQQQGHTVHIYTTSFRSSFKIRFTLYYYNIRVARIVTQTQNQRVLRLKGYTGSKYPPAFGFNVHVDDLKGVGIEAANNNFKAIIIATTNTNWVHTVLEQVGGSSC